MNKLTLYVIAALVVLSSGAATIRKLKEKNQDPIFLNETYYTGYANIDNRGDLFYWWFESRNDPATDPLVIWLTGGPGCSSELALFEENGPYKIDNNLTLRINPWSWNNVANVLYLDQPLGTGYSNVTNSNDYVHNEFEVASDFYTFLTAFYEAYPQFNGRKLYITGESYGGHYVPAISAYLFANNTNPNIMYVGSAIGNGLVSAYWQYPQYATFALSVGLIKKLDFDVLKIAFAACQDLIKDAPFEVAYIECQEAFGQIVGNPPRFNYYDYKLPCKGSLCYNFSIVSDFLKQSDVKQALGVEGHSWQDCNSEVYQELVHDWFTDETAHVALLVDNSVPVLVYSGDLDFICNWMGGQEWTNRMAWNYTNEFSSLNLTNLTAYGESKTYGALTFYKVFNAGHMVPMDQPQAALDMLVRFLSSGNLTLIEEEKNISA